MVIKFKAENTEEVNVRWCVRQVIIKTPSIILSENALS